MPNGANGIEVRNSIFETFHGDTSSYNSRDGMLIVNGEGENVTNSEADNNGGSGIHLKRSTSSHIVGMDSNANTYAGIWLDGSRGIAVDGSGSVNNGTADVYIGCSPKQEPDGTTCTDVGLPASNGNLVDQSQFNNEADTTLFGIGIDKGNHNNQMISNNASAATQSDLVDENRNCDSNQWVLNRFDTASSSSCIH